MGYSLWVEHFAKIPTSGRIGQKWGTPVEPA
jgi:hypothetical protein